MTRDEEISQAVHKASVIESLVQHEGWKLIVEMLEQFITKEMMGLSNGEPDTKYLKKIGFLQTLVYFQAIPKLIKDKRIQQYVLAQGRMSGFRWLQKAPQYFFDGRQLAERYAKQLQEGKGSELQLKERKQWLEEQKNV